MICVCVCVCVGGGGGACLLFHEFRRGGGVHLNIRKAMSDLQVPFTQRHNVTSLKARIIKYVKAEAQSAQQLVTGWTIREIESRRDRYFFHLS